MSPAPGGQKSWLPPLIDDSKAVEYTVERLFEHVPNYTSCTQPRGLLPSGALTALPIVKFTRKENLPRERSPRSTECGRMPEEAGLTAASSPEMLPLRGSQRRFLSRPSQPLEGYFAATIPLQNAHGFWRGHSMMCLARRGDVRTAVPHLVIKGDTPCLSLRGGL